MIKGKSDHAWELGKSGRATALSGQRSGSCARLSPPSGLACSSSSLWGQHEGHFLREAFPDPSGQGQFPVLPLPSHLPHVCLLGTSGALR